VRPTIPKQRKGCDEHLCENVDVGSVAGGWPSALNRHHMPSYLVYFGVYSMEYLGG